MCPKARFSVSCPIVGIIFCCAYTPCRVAFSMEASKVPHTPCARVLLRPVRLVEGSALCVPAPCCAAVLRVLRCVAWSMVCVGSIWGVCGVAGGSRTAVPAPPWETCGFLSDIGKIGTLYFPIRFPIARDFRYDENNSYTAPISLTTVVSYVPTLYQVRSTGYMLF